MTCILDGARMTSREAAHAHIAETLALPEYYGRNLDALWDCLSEMSGADIALMNTADMLNAMKGYGCKLLMTFYDAAEEGAIAFQAL